MSTSALESFGSPLADGPALAEREESEGGEDRHEALPNLAEDSGKDFEWLAGIEGPIYLTLVPTKTCATCGEPKPLTEFHRQARHRDGRDNRCKECKRGERKRRYAEDPEAAIAATYVWKKKNRIRARVQRLKHYARRVTATDTVPGDPGDLTADQWSEVVETYRVTDLTNPGRRERYRCAYCGARKRLVDLQIDHVVPLSKGGRNTKSNVVPACGPCNAGKCDRDLRPSLPSPHLAEATTLETTPETTPEGPDSLEPDRVTEEDLSFP